MSALPPKADIGTQSRNVRFVPKAEICSLFDHLIGGDQQQRVAGAATDSTPPSLAHAGSAVTHETSIRAL